MVEISYWHFFTLFWLTCGVIGYSMYMGHAIRAGTIKRDRKDVWLKAGALCAGPGAFVVSLIFWTEKDGMWL